jgi:DNA topoisomerase-3
MFSASFRSCVDPGYMQVMEYSFKKKGTDEKKREDEEETDQDKLPSFVNTLKKGVKMTCLDLSIKEGETKPPKRYNSGSMILAMENAGQLIEEEELREQIRGSGIGTSATRAEILKKLFSNKYLALNKKTQIITPTLMGEMIYDTVDCSIRSLLNPKLTASWELGLTRVSEGTVTEQEYLEKLNGFVARNTNNVKNSNWGSALQAMYMRDSQFYKKPAGQTSYPRRKSAKKGKANASE